MLSDKVKVEDWGRRLKRKSRSKTDAYREVMHAVSTLNNLAEDVWGFADPDSETEGNELAEILLDCVRTLDEVAGRLDEGEYDQYFGVGGSCGKTLRYDVLSQRKKVKGRVQARAHQAIKASRFPYGGVRPALNGVACDDLVVEKAKAALKGKYDARTISPRDLPALQDDDVDVDVQEKSSHKGKARGAKVGR